MRTRLSVCARKQRFADAEAAKAAALTATVELRYYRCDRCFSFHLTSRTKGKRVLEGGCGERARIDPPPLRLSHDLSV